MKKLYALMALALLLSSCATTSTKNRTAVPNTRGKAETINKTTQKAPGWAYYSQGLYFKYEAMRAHPLQKRKKLLGAAIASFKEAAKENKELDKVFIELSECYYYSFEFQAAIRYALESIKINPNNIQPYYHIYNINMKLRNFRDAGIALENYLKVKPNSIHVQYLLSEHYYKNLKDTKQAIESLQKVVKLAKTEQSGDYYREKAHYILGNLYYKSQDYPQAIDNFKAVLKVNPMHFESVFMLAYLNMTIYNLPEAEKYSQRYLARNGNNNLMNSILGRIYYLEDKPKAIHYLKKSMGSNTIEGTISKGLYYEITQKKEEAEKYLKLAIKLDPRLVAPHIALAKLKLYSKEKDDAFNQLLTAGAMAYNNKLYAQGIKALLKANTIKNTVPETYFYLGRLYEDQKQYSTAVFYFKKALELKPSVDMNLHVGYLFALKKDYSRAYTFFDNAEKMDEKNSRPHFFRGLVYLWEKKYPESESSLARAITLKKDKEEYYFYLAIALDKQKKLQGAIEALESAIEKNPESDRSYNYLGYIYADNNIKIDRSLELILKALEIDPTNGAYLDSLGWVYYRQGKYSQALKKLTEAETRLKSRNNMDPVVYDHIGDTYLKLGQKKKALEFWKKSIKIEKNSIIDKKIKKYTSQ